MNQSPNLNRSWEESQQIIKNLEAEIAQLKSEKEVKSCQCHVIDTNKTTILMWADKNSPQFKAKCPGCACHAQSFIQKIANQKFIGLIRTDKHRVVYWKFRNLVEETNQVKETKKAEVKANLIKCWECKEEVEIIGELDESAPLVCSDCEKKKLENQVSSDKQKTQTETNPDLKEKVKENVPTN